MRAQNIEDVYPLSSLQEGLIFHTLSDPGSGVYVVQMACDLRGELDTMAFRRAWQGVLARHSVLRTAFVWEGLERPVQVVCREIDLPLVELDWGKLTPAAREAELEACLAADRKRGFELSRAPLMRLILCRIDARRHQLIWTHHHLLLDGWSVQLLLREVFILYEACRGGGSVELPPALPYRNYIAWLRSRDLAVAEEFWRRELAGFTAPTPLPAGGPPQRSTDGAHGARELRLSAAISEALATLARRRQITLNTLLQGLWAWILSRTSGEDDVVFGFVSAGRPPELAGVEHMVGLFLNTLPLRVQVRPGARLIPWLSELQAAQVRAREFDYSPLGQVHGWSDVPRGVDLFHSLLDFAHYGSEVSLSELATSLEIAAVRFSERPNYPLAIIAGLGGTLSLRMLYQPPELDEVTVVRLQGYFAHLLEAITADPERCLADLPWLSRGECWQLLGEWNDTAQPLPGGSIYALFAARASQAPAAPAVLFGDRAYTYVEVERWAEGLARRLRFLGVRRGDLVGIYLERTWEMVPALLGILRSGAAYVPLDAGYPSSRVRWILSALGIRWLVTQTALLAARPDALTELPRLEHLITVDRPVEDPDVLGADGRSTWLASDTADLPDDLAGLESAPEDLAYIIFTSGSTGTPKGVMERHEAVVNLIRWVNDTFAVSPADRVLFITSLCFDLSVYDVFGLLAAGGSVRVASAEELRDPTRLVRALCEEPVTFWDSAPAALQQLVPLLPQPGGADRSRLRLVFLSGDWVPVSLPKRLRDVFVDARIIALGGATEATVWSNFFPVREVDPAWSSIPYGRPITNARYHVLDGALAPCPVGVAGDLYIAGDCLAAGYAAAPALTAWKFLPDPFGGDRAGRMYRTGDRARFWPDGRLEFLGRLDHQVKIRGFRIELGEIETNLAERDDVREAVVLAREDEPGRKRLVAYVVPRGGDAPEQDALRRFLAARLPEYMVPSAFVFLPAMPVTANGKLDRGALPAPEAKAAERELVAPRGAREQRLAALWAEVLHRERVGRHDNFFEIGGDSILSIQIVSRARQAGMPLTPGQLFEHQTIAELALVAGEVEEAVEADEGAVCGELPMTPVQSWFFAERMAEPHHFNQSLLLAAEEELDVGCLRGALATLLDHHDALRLRFAQGEDGWRQWVAEPGGEIPFAVVDFTALAPQRRTAAFSPCVDAVQASLHLVAGPRLRVVLIRSVSGDRLLLVIHHLLVDGVSWRILLEDLHTVYEQLRAGKRIALPPKTTSYKRWAEGLVELAGSDALAGEIAYWSAVPPAPPAPLPVDRPQGRNQAGSAAAVTVALDAQETSTLLTRAPEAYRTQINDLLLTALVETIGGWTGERKLLIELEGHGREELIEGADLSRTVGWFTSMFPVWLDLSGSQDVGARIKAVKETLRRIPRRGAGYGVLRYLGGEERRAAFAGQPRPQVGFNYLGQLDTALPAALRPAPESAGGERSPRQRRRHLLEVTAHVRDGRLRATWTYGGELYRRATIEALAERFLTYLRQLSEHCLAADTGGRTPSDFPLAALDSASLDRIVGTGRGIEDVYPLSPLQQGMLFHSLHDPHSGVYCQQLRCVLEGELDAEALEAAWQQAVDRHSVLRTAFEWDELEEPLQVVHRQAHLACQLLDWSSLTPAEQEEQLIALLRHDRRRSFDFQRPPLMRLCLIRLDGWRHQMIWTHHHLLLDGWSLPILFREVFALYQARVGAREVRLTTPRPYRDFIAWLAAREMAEAEAFWRRELAGITAPTLIGEGARREGARFGEREFGRVSVQLSPAATSALRDLARGRQLTLSSVLLGAWGLLLARYTGRPEVIFGAVTAGRPGDLAGVETMIGPFLNTLPLRLAAPAGAAAAEWLGEVQRIQVAARKYEFTPLRKIQDWSDVPRGTPLFESLVIFENYPVEEILSEGVDGITVSHVTMDERTNYPLALVGVPGRRLTLELIFDGRVYERSFAARGLRHLVRLLEGLAAHPARPLAELPLLTRAERQGLLVEWNDTALTAAAERSCLHELVAAQAARTPDAVAVSRDDASLSYRALVARAERLGSHLRTLGVGADVRVGVCCERSPDMVIGLLAVLAAGGAYVPLDPAYPAPRLAFMLEDAAVAVLLTQERLLDRFPALSRAGRVLCLDRMGDDLATAPRAPAAPDALAYVIYTSGSTGRPKGVAIAHRSAVALLEWARRVFPDERLHGVLASTSICFDLSIFELFLPLSRGGRVILADNALALATLPQAERVTLINTVPSAMAELVRLGAVPRSAGVVNLAGEPLRRQLADGVYAAAAVDEVWNLYGPSEATTYSTFTRIDRGGELEPHIGRPVGGSRLYVLDRRLRPVPAGVVGELYMAGRGLARGYLERPALTAEKFLPDACGSEPGGRAYRTGDLARFLPDGNVGFLGRIDHQVKVRGFRIELGEIEAALIAHPGVREAAVVLRQDDPATARLVAYLVAGDEVPSHHDLRESLRHRLPDFMVPSLFVALDRLPLTANGKVDRGALPAPDGSRPDLGKYEAPRTPVEESVAAIWADLLKVDRIGVADDFFDLGGDSLIAMRLSSRLRRVFEVEVSLERIFEQPTVAAIAGLVERLQLELVGSADEDELLGLLAEIEGLSGEGAEHPAGRSDLEGVG